MLARQIRLSLALEFLAYAGIGAALHAQRSWTAAAAVAAAIAFALAVRLFLVCFTSAFAWIYRSPRPPEHRVGLAGTVRLVAGEYLTLLADNFAYLPFESLALRPDPAPARSERIPVLLVHGYLSNRGYFRPLVRWLEARGVSPIHAPNFTAVFSSIEHFAAELHREVERIAAASGHGRVVLVCHSMGGLAARRYLHEHGEGRVAALVTIASPHHGTALAVFGVGEHGRQMRRGSAFLRELADAEARRPPRLRAASIYTPHDNLVAPQESSRLSWARNIAVPGIEHIETLASERVLQALLEELRAAGAAPPG